MTGRLDMPELSALSARGLSVLCVPYAEDRDIWEALAEDAGLVCGREGLRRGALVEQWVNLAVMACYGGEVDVDRSPFLPHPIEPERLRRRGRALLELLRDRPDVRRAAWSVRDLAEGGPLGEAAALTHFLEAELARDDDRRSMTRMTPLVPFKRIGGHTLPAPAYAHPGDSGLDLYANVEAMPADGPGWAHRGRLLTLRAGARAVVPSGFAVAIPAGYEGQVRPRSGRSRDALEALTILGTVDAPYRGEVGVIVVNTSPHDVHMSHGDKIAQLVVAPVARAELVEVDELGDTERGAAGYGSTGR